MQERRSGGQKKAAVALCLGLLVLIQQVSAAPLDSQVQSRGGRGVQALRRTARMTPLWRIMNSKPFGAYCQNNYECLTGLCRAGHCSTSQGPLSQPVNY